MLSITHWNDIMDESQEQIEALQQAYQNDDEMRHVLDAFSRYQNSMRTVNVDVIWNRVGRGKIKRSQVVTALKRLQELGFGTYTKGAKGHPSRFGFPRAKGPLWISLRAQGEKEEDLPDDTTDDPTIFEGFDDINAGGDPSSVIHRFRLRQDKEVVFNLPADLTFIEAKRLSLWLKSIPFDSDGDEF